MKFTRIDRPSRGPAASPRHALALLTTTALTFASHTAWAQTQVPGSGTVPSAVPAPAPAPAQEEAAAPSVTVPSDAGAPPTTGSAEAQAADEPVSTQQAQDVVVTGSRIVRDGYQSPTPLSVIGAEQLTTNAASNVAQVVADLPAFAGSGSTRSNTTNGAAGSAGINSLNLRSLGAARTLVLVDGHRITPALSTGVVDVNAIPQSLISRVDVVTGGASSTYGSDAVAGVVNFVLDKTMSGVRGEASAGVTRYGDGKNYKLNLAAGSAFGDGRGHVLFAAEHVYDEGIGRDRRDWTRRGYQQISNPAYTATNGQPQRLFLENVGYMTAAPGGVVSSGPLRGTLFGKNGQPSQLMFGDIQADPFMRGGDWQSNDLRRTNAIAPSESRQSIFGRANFEASEAFNLYAQAYYVRAKTRNDVTTAYMIGNSGPLIQIDNAYLPQSVRDRMVAAGVTSIRVGTLNQDLGILQQITERETKSFTVGVDGRFAMLGGDWQWDAYVQHGESDNLATFPTNISRRNYTLATDAVRNPATGTIVCRSTLTSPNNGCSPYNALGIGVNDPNGAGVRFIRAASRSDLTVKQTVAAGSLTGEPFSTWAGPVSIAVSAEYRKDSANSIIDPTSLAADHVFANYSRISGSTNVKEAAFETVVPLAKDTGWAESWDVNGAVRYTSYSLAGNVATWKVGTTFSPISDVTLRATRSRDIRAPNLQETFLPQQTVRQSIFDPFTNTTPAFDQITTGNRNLRPEKANTLGLGVVFRPCFLRGFSTSVDYWSIDIGDAISSISAADTLLLCFNGSAPELCNNITRVNGLVTQVISQNINIANLKARGLDFEASYRSDLDGIGLPGNLDLHGNFTKYLESFVDNRIAPRDNVGENSGANPPDWRASATLGYHLDALRTSLTARAFSSGKEISNYIECTSTCPASTALNPTVNRNYLPGRFYLDFALSYDFSLGGQRALSTFLNVRNLTNKDPAVTVVGNAFGNGANAVLYDVDGTVFRAGVRIKIRPASHGPRRLDKPPDGLLASRTYDQVFI